MISNRPLTVTFTRQDEPPRFIKGTLTADKTWSLFPMTEPESLAVAEVVERAGGKKGAVLIWSSAEDPRFNPFLAEAHCFSVARDSKESAPIQQFATYRNVGKELAVAIRVAWNSFESLHIVLSNTDSLDSLTRLTEQISKRSDEERTGLDWENHWFFRHNSGCLAVAGFFLGAGGFLLKLLFSGNYRRELMDPFRQVKGMTLARENGAVLEKGGHDESIGLEILTANRDLPEDVELIFEGYGIPIVVSEKRRESHWESIGDS